MVRARSVVLAAAAMAAVAAIAVLVTLGSPNPPNVADAAAGSNRFEPLPIRARVLRSDRRYLTAWLQRPTRVYNRPGGRVVARFKERTRWGTPRVLAVEKVRRRGRWLGVLTEHRPNSRLGWIRAVATRPGGVREALVADLSRRTVTLLRDGRRVLRVRVAIGRPGNPTPTGRFAITDVLRVRGASPYGCCVIAFSGRQTRVPANWTGGDRLALHATSDASAIGRAVSIGCLRARERAMRRLLRENPQPGTPVFIRR